MTLRPARPDRTVPEIVHFGVAVSRPLQRDTAHLFGHRALCSNVRLGSPVRNGVIFFGTEPDGGANSKCPKTAPTLIWARRYRADGQIESVSPDFGPSPAGVDGPVASVLLPCPVYPEVVLRGVAMIVTEQAPEPFVDYDLAVTS